MKIFWVICMEINGNHSLCDNTLETINIYLGNAIQRKFDLQITDLCPVSINSFM